MKAIASSLYGNWQHLDGGAMFGNAPRAMWSKWLQPDQHNLLRLACRCLLLEEEGGRRLLFEAGIGAFFQPKLRARFGVEPEHHQLVEELARCDLSPSDIDVVVLSHLHFDHAGGLLTQYVEGQEPRLLFDNATFVVGQTALDRAEHPHLRDRASFIPSLPRLLHDSGRLEIVSDKSSSVLGSSYCFHPSNGHTPGMLLTEVALETGPLVFGGDLVPGIPWLNTPITMGYDRYAERLINEKSQVLERLFEQKGRIFFAHDPSVAMAEVIKDKRGRFTAGEMWSHLDKIAL